MLVILSDPERREGESKELLLFLHLFSACHPERNRGPHGQVFVHGVGSRRTCFCFSFLSLPSRVAGGFGLMQQFIKLRVPPVPRIWGPGRVRNIFSQLTR
jgi:hypothetical protein